MSKRVYVRLGDIFCVEADDFKCYFQYITRDKSQLNSQVIRVFKQHYPLDYIPNMDEIVNGKIEFYAHTILQAGLHFNAWYKIGSHKQVGNINNIMFRWFSDGCFSHIIKSYKWYIWKINEPSVFVGEMTDEYRTFDLGLIFSYESN